MKRRKLTRRERLKIRIGWKADKRLAAELNRMKVDRDGALIDHKPLRQPVG